MRLRLREARKKENSKMVARATGSEPVRSCIVCRSKRSKGDLLRLVKAMGGGVAVDEDGTAPGRGAYVCREESCRTRLAPRVATALRVGRIDAEQVRVMMLGTDGER